MFHDIFSKEKTPIKKNPKLSKIIIDIHEKNSLVPSCLSSLNIPYEFQHLEIGDYLINSIALERKTISDLKSSIISKRIFEQLKNIKQYSSLLLIIEGSQSSLCNNEILHENAIRGFLLSLIRENQIPFILTENEKDTASYLSLLARKNNSPQISFRHKKLLSSPKEQALFILEGFPGIGPAKSKSLLSKFKSLKNTFNASEEELRDILGKESQEFISLLESSL